MNPAQQTKISRFLSLVLRHRPDKIGVILDEQGWTDVDDLITALNRHHHPIDFEELEEIVETNDKRRFSLSEDCRRIRANQGHSVDVDLGYSPLVPPDFLYHGTVERFLPSILAQGLHKGQRHHVHLSTSTKVATAVGKRRGNPIILTIRAAAMHAAGSQFFRSDNGVWLTDHVPPQFINLPSASPEPAL